MKRFLSGVQSPLSMALLAAVSVSALTGCRSDSKLLQWIRPETLANIQARLDPHLTEDERAALVYDTKRLGEVQVQAVEGSLWDLSFGSTDMGGVLRYLDDRVNLVVSRNTKLEDILHVTKYDADRKLPSWMQSSASETAEGDDAPKGMIIAQNPGGQFWLLREMMAPGAELEVRLGSTRVPLTTSRVGIMQIGEGYVARRPDGGFLLSSMERIGTLVHEGRHSDCTGGIDELDLALVRSGFLPRNPSCLHLHTACPAGHPLEGIPACDSQPWGAYSMGTIFGVTVAKQCKNCSEEEIQGALIDAMDSIDRIIPLKAMMAGELGAPDMSSSGVRRMKSVR